MASVAAGMSTLWTSASIRETSHKCTRVLDCPDISTHERETDRHRWPTEIIIDIVQPLNKWVQLNLPHFHECFRNSEEIILKSFLFFFLWNAWKCCLCSIYSEVVSTIFLTCIIMFLNIYEACFFHDTVIGLILCHDLINKGMITEIFLYICMVLNKLRHLNSFH